MAVFELLRQLAVGTEVDPAARIAELENRKAQIEIEIESIRNGQLFLMDATQVKDRFLLMASTARGLLSDFREVEQNFRNLDRAVRARIAGWEDGKARCCRRFSASGMSSRIPIKAKASAPSGTS
jgi:hypothetical protein